MGLLKAIIYFTISYFLANLIIANIETFQRNPYIGPYIRYLNIERLILLILFLLLVVF